MAADTNARKDGNNVEQQHNPQHWQLYAQHMLSYMLQCRRTSRRTPNDLTWQKAGAAVSAKPQTAKLSSGPPYLGVYVNKQSVFSTHRPYGISIYYVKLVLIPI